MSVAINTNIKSELDRLKAAKAAIVTAIIDKGGSADNSQHFEDLAAEIMALPSNSAPGETNATFCMINDYIPGAAAYTRVDSVTISGLGKVNVWDEYEVDLSEWNGEYELHANSVNETNLDDMMFKKQGDNKFLFRVFDSGNTDNWYWILNYDDNRFSAGIYNATLISEQLASGVWEGYESGVSVNVTVELNTTEVPAVLEQITATKVRYTEGEFGLSSTSTHISKYDETPRICAIYLHHNDKLIGNFIRMPDPTNLAQVKAMITGGFNFMFPDFELREKVEEQNRLFADLNLYFDMNDKGRSVVDRKQGVVLERHGGSIRYEAGGLWDGCWVNNGRIDNYLSGSLRTFPGDYYNGFTVILFYKSLYDPSDNTSVSASILEIGSRDRGTGYGIRYNKLSPTYESFSLRIGKSDYMDIPGGGHYCATATAGEWHMLAFVCRRNKDTNNLEFFASVDGMSDSTIEVPSQYKLEDQHSISLFGIPSQNSYSANTSAQLAVDDVFIYDTALDKAYINSMADWAASEGKIRIFKHDALGYGPIYNGMTGNGSVDTEIRNQCVVTANIDSGDPAGLFSCGHHGLWYVTSNICRADDGRYIDITYPFMFNPTGCAILSSSGRDPWSFKTCLFQAYQEDDKDAGYWVTLSTLQGEVVGWGNTQNFDIATTGRYRRYRFLFTEAWGDGTMWDGYPSAPVVPYGGGITIGGLRIFRGTRTEI